ncbi:Trafficking protein particle complex subunit-like protein [Thalictrum thalictroides]|uniref:Trafficking protein particle complex subunit-like protein n=1 Tax=Thalictrum thalictroides TaxID=46969 RepID=A0A7J6VCD0_THATH|nr:Trafficking protein particle complex subunit-like protein [Thalictrum thalictroides]
MLMMVGVVELYFDGCVSDDNGGIAMILDILKDKIEIKVRMPVTLTKSEQSGKLECVSLLAKLGPYYFTIICVKLKFLLDHLPLWKFEDHVETSPTKDPDLSFSSQKVIQIEEQDPQIDLVLGATGLAN